MAPGAYRSIAVSKPQGGSAKTGHAGYFKTGHSGLRSLDVVPVARFSGKSRQKLRGGV